MLGRSLLMKASGAVIIGPPDQYFSSVGLLLHGDGANGSTTVIDSSPNAFTPSTNVGVAVSTAQFVYGGASLAFGGSSDLRYAASNAFAFGLGSFTIELWLRSVNTSNFNIISCGTGNQILGNWGLIATAASINWQDVSLASNLYTRPVGSMLNGQFHHLAVCRDGTSNRMFFDGVQQGATVSDSTNYTGTAVVTIGSVVYGRLNGNIDDLRVTKGVARYTANFTPPTAPFPDY
jgi:hypothetical protein